MNRGNFSTKLHIRKDCHCYLGIAGFNFTPYLQRVSNKHPKHISSNMDKIVWLDKYNTGIAEIDTQHRQIAEYLNQLREAHLQRSQKAIKEVLVGITDYTWSHFAFEEALMEQAAYNFAKAHKNVHEMFIKRVDTFVSRFQAGEDITEEFYSLLKRWLINHIQRDDAAYIRPVKAHLQELSKNEETGASEKAPADSWLSRAVRRFFGG